MNFEYQIENDLSYRDNELSYLKKSLNDYVWKDWETVAIKTGILLLYAHWEWFCKKTSNTYIKAIQKSWITIDKINHNFLVNHFLERNFSIWNYIKTFIVKRFLGRFIKVKYLRIIINTENNLKYTTFKNQILKKVCIDQWEIEKQFQDISSKAELSKLDFFDKWKIIKYLSISSGKISPSSFDSYDNYFINTINILVHYRNKIAHWDTDLCLTYEQFIFLFESVRCLLVAYKDTIVKYISTLK